MRRTVFHVDVDEFVVAVELRRRPELRGKPVVVGGAGDARRRGVVASASYEARASGIEAGMPLRTAARRAGDAVFLPIDVPAYQAAAREVEAALRGIPGSWEIAGWDEAYLERDTREPRAVAAEIRQRLLDRTGLSCAVGIGDNKLQAKVASLLAKPGGVVRVDARSWPAVVGPLPPDVLAGIGPRRRRRLQRLGIHRVYELADADERVLARAFGPSVGPWLRRLARGEDDAPLVPHPPARRSHGCAYTYEVDVDDADVVRHDVAVLAAAVARDLRRERRAAVHVVVTVRFAPFETHSHGVDTSRASADADALVDAALEALDRFELDRPVRLVGVRAALAPVVSPAAGRRPPTAAIGAGAHALP